MLNITQLFSPSYKLFPCKTKLIPNSSPIENNQYFHYYHQLQAQTFVNRFYLNLFMYLLRHGTCKKLPRLDCRYIQ